VSDLLEINLPKERTWAEIVNFVKMIETFYFDRIHSLTHKCKNIEKSARKERTRSTMRVAERHDLEKIFLDCVLQTKYNIKRRRER